MKTIGYETPLLNKIVQYEVRKALIDFVDLVLEVDYAADCYRLPGTGYITPEGLELIISTIVGDY